jgi:Rox3 mediator complex subunit
MESPKPSKRPRLEGSFTPLYPSAAPSTSSPIADDHAAAKDLPKPLEETSTLTPVSDVKPSREDIHERDVPTPPIDQGDNRADGSDVEMAEDQDETRPDHEPSRTQTNHDWHWDEPTARPEAVAARLNASIDNLYKLASTPLVRGEPHPSENLISLYGLDELTTSVRRVDPVTGEKVNKIRKSYEGKAKELRIAGRNKAIITPGEFSNLLYVPDEDWHNTAVHGKELSRGLNLKQLQRACAILPGKLPDKEAEKWKAILATDEPPAAKPAASVKAPGGAQRLGASQTGPLQNASGQGINAPPRPIRSTSKRSYQDSSFSGYGEGFVDDEDVSEDDGRMSATGARKRRKKEQDYSVSPLPPQQQSYGVGVVARH